MNSIIGRVLAIPAAAVTNSGTSSSRALHVDLASQQRRLRHLRSIAARNIVNKNGSPLLDTFFTLHLCVGDCISRDFYKSEVIRDSLNPTWRSLDFGMLPDLLDTSASCFVVRIWGGQEEQYTLLIEWKVNLDGLRYTGQQIRSRNPNEIIFGLNDGSQCGGTTASRGSVPTVSAYRRGLRMAVSFRKHHRSPQSWISNSKKRLKNAESAFLRSENC